MFSAPNRLALPVEAAFLMGERKSAEKRIIKIIFLPLQSYRVIRLLEFIPAPLIDISER